MRQQQQRTRNRNRGRKSTNPLSRNFESNGPDVKIRGNASHIAEKYNVLARDALTSGDTVMAENYFQHAEHYFRIIAANQKTIPQRENGQLANNSQSDDSGKLDTDESSEADSGEGPQPEFTDVPAEVAMKREKSAVSETQDVNSSDTTNGEERSSNRRNGRRPVKSQKPANDGPKRDARKRAAPKVEEGSSSPKDIAVDGVSKDAALLPSSIIGKSDEDDAASQPLTVKD
jgi:hypothetical protein